MNTISNNRFEITPSTVIPGWFRVKHWFVWEAFLSWEDLEAFESLIQTIRQENSNNMSSYPDLSLGGNSDSLGQVVEGLA